MTKPRTSKTLSDAARSAVGAATIAARITIQVLASVLQNEQDGWRFGRHARDMHGNLLPLQADKLAAARAYTAAHGYTGRAVTARAIADGYDILGGRHMLACLAPDTLVNVEILPAISDLDALSIASHGNAEGSGFTETANLEQIQAIVLYLANHITPEMRDTNKRLPHSQAAYAYEMNLTDANANPFSSKKKPADGWTYRHVSAEQIGGYAACSAKTAERALRLLSGLWYTKRPISALAGLTGQEMIERVAYFRELRGLLGADVDMTPAQLETERAIFEALKSGKTITGGSNARDLATLTKAGKGITIEEQTAAETGSKKNGKRPVTVRIVALIDQARQLAEREDTILTDTDKETINAAVAKLNAKVQANVTKTAAEIASKDAKQADEEQEKEQEDDETTNEPPLSPELTAELARRRGRKTA